MWVLTIQLIFATHLGGYTEPKQTIGYFTTQADCNIQGWKMTRRDKFLVWQCEPETE